MAVRLSKPSEDMVPPVMMIFAMFGLTLAALMVVSFARITDHPISATPPVEAVVASRTLVLSGDMSGAARVTDLDGTVVADLDPERGGFISGVWRVVQRERTKHGAPMGAPIVLERSASGRISITDPETGWRADLMGFGIDNARAFARLLHQPEGSK